MYTFTIEGPPRTKKNSSRLVLKPFPRLLPSKAYEKWEAEAMRFALLEKTKLRDEQGAILPIDGPVNVSALFFHNAKVVEQEPDPVGLYQALADFLEAARFIINDRQIRSWNGSEVMQDLANPRIEVTISLRGGDRR